MSSIKIKNRWITPEKLMARWGLESHELLQCVKKGLTVYSKKNLKPFLIVGIESELQKGPFGEFARWEYLDSIHDLDISDCIFDPDDVDIFEALNELGPWDRSSRYKEIVKILEAAEKEILILLEAVRKPDWKTKESNREKLFKDNALRKFNEKDGGFFKYIKKEYLEDDSIYELIRYGHERGDFIGKLYVRILEGKGYGKHNYQDIYKLYKRVLRK